MHAICDLWRSIRLIEFGRKQNTFATEYELRCKSPVLLARLSTDALIVSGDYGANFKWRLKGFALGDQRSLIPAVNTLRSEQNGRHFAGDVYDNFLVLWFKFLWILFLVLLTIYSWYSRLFCDKPSTEPIMAQCVDISTYKHIGSLLV